MSNTRQDLTNKTFGNFTVLRFSHKDKFGQSMWLVKCSCGNERAVRGTAISRGATKSCGCISIRRENVKKKFGIGGGFWPRIQANAKRRGIKIKITKLQAQELFEKQQGKCAISGETIILDTFTGKKTASLDRIDSSKPYQIGNIQWIHKDINLMKNVLSQDLFLKWIQRIYLFRFNLTTAESSGSMAI